MPDLDRVCLECGHSYGWHLRDRAKATLGVDPGMERGCYRRIGTQPCACPAFGASNDRLVRAPAAFAGTAIRTVLLTVLLIVMGLALLYAYRSETPAVPTVSLNEAIQDVNAGRVNAVTIAGSKATLDYTDSFTRKSTFLPSASSGADPLSQAVIAYNNANPTRAVQLRYQPTDPAFSTIGSVLLALLPVLLIGGLFLYLMRNARSRPDR